MMRTNNKMKDFEAESKKWWEVVVEYFIKELENNLAQHKTNEKIPRYKLEVYQMNFSNFICGSPISIKVSGLDEEIETWLSGTTHEEEVPTEEPHDLKSGTTLEENI
jgi:hypothetical protein